MFDQNIGHQLLVKLDHSGTLNHTSSFYSNQWCDMQQIIELNNEVIVFGAYFDSLFVNESLVQYSDSLQTIMIRLDSNLQYIDHVIIQTGGQVTVKGVDADTSIVKCLLNLLVSFVLVQIVFWPIQFTVICWF